MALSYTFLRNLRMHSPPIAVLSTPVGNNQTLTLSPTSTPRLIALTAVMTAYAARQTMNTANTKVPRKLSTNNPTTIRQDILTTPLNTTPSSIERETPQI